MDYCSAITLCISFHGNARRSEARREGRRKLIKIQNGITLSVLFPEIIKTSALNFIRRALPPPCLAPFPFAGQTYGLSPTRLANFFPFSPSPGTLSRRITRKLRTKYITPYLDYGIALSSEGIGKRKIYDGPRFAGDAEGKVLSAVSEISITDPSNSSYSKRGDIRGTESPRSALVPIPPPVNAIRNVPECIPFQFGMRRSRGDARRSTYPHSERWHVSLRAWIYRLETDPRRAPATPFGPFQMPTLDPSYLGSRD